MWTTLLTMAAAIAMATGSAQRCHVCKTAGALELFANLHCDEVPGTAPDCSLTSRGTGGNDFFQNCPQNSNCITITKQGEELRMCTQKRRVETMKTTDGVVMEVCGSSMCNSAARSGLSLALTLLSALILVAVITGQRE